MTKKEIIAELSKLGVTFDPNASAKDLAELLKAQPKEPVASAPDAAAPSAPVPSAPTVADEKMFVHLKTRAFFDDKRRVEPAVYVVNASEISDRIKRLGKNEASIYPANKVPVDVLNIAAKSAGIDTSKMTSDEITDVVFNKVSKPAFLFKN